MTLIEICAKAKVASAELAKLSTDDKNNALQRMGDALEANSRRILDANQKDVDSCQGQRSESLTLG